MMFFCRLIVHFWVCLISFPIACFQNLRNHGENFVKSIRGRFFYVSLAEKSRKSSYGNQAICFFFFFVFLVVISNPPYATDVLFLSVVGFVKTTQKKFSSFLLLCFLISQTFSRTKKEKGRCLCTYLWFSIVYRGYRQCLQQYWATQC